MILGSVCLCLRRSNFSELGVLLSFIAPHNLSTIGFSVHEATIFSMKNPETFTNTLSGNQPQQNFVDIPSVGASDSNQSHQQISSSNFGSHMEDRDYSVWRDGRNEMLSSTGPSQRYYDPSQYKITALPDTIPNSKYLKVAQELLDEVVAVKASKQHESHRFGFKVSKVNDGELKNSGALPSPVGSSNPQDTSTNSVSEQQDLRNRMSNLLSMLDEIDRRYKQHSQHMQIVVSSFDLIAGCGASNRYTALALRVISNQFHCLRDAVNRQIKAVRRSLGEQDTGDNGSSVGISRLRFVDQRLRQQRTLQQFGMLQQNAWRPQRGLPESSVSVLRAWLFEHFLHPYPKDSDKSMLAKQAGLTRSQVSNWFINARVRLWKPMVEEMYKEEIYDPDVEANSSLDNAIKAATNEPRVSEGRSEVLLQNTESAATEGSQLRNQFEESSNLAAHGNISELTAGTNANECNLLKDMIIQSGGSTGGRFMTAATGYQIAELGRLRSGGGVSLTLGLQHCDNSGILTISGRTHHNFINTRRDDLCTPDVSSLGPNTSNYDCSDAGYQHNRWLFLDYWFHGRVHVVRLPQLSVSCL
ncbi:BEL1-like homeodomain protein 7 isoform X2 [Papaver somniferum]|uniref:BEL1-like homeodomain protein 7 isoform X2 n=1 Tax=Papaver somniferum TaxID=3469 RepID=UPI000E70100E|nr:BEL1-like homeodomain protein 7 isoform X2 [Papaver somniferum]